MCSNLILKNKLKSGGKKLSLCTHSFHLVELSSLPLKVSVGVFFF